MEQKKFSNISENELKKISNFFSKRIKLYEEDLEYLKKNNDLGNPLFEKNKESLEFWLEHSIEKYKEIEEEIKKRKEKISNVMKNFHEN